MIYRSKKNNLNLVPIVRQNLKSRTGRLIKGQEHCENITKGNKKRTVSYESYEIPIKCWRSDNEIMKIATKTAHKTRRRGEHVSKTPEVHLKI